MNQDEWREANDQHKRAHDRLSDFQMEEGAFRYRDTFQCALETVRLQDEITAFKRAVKVAELWRTTLSEPKGKRQATVLVPADDEYAAYDLETFMNALGEGTLPPEHLEALEKHFGL